MTDTQYDEIVSRYVTQHTPTMGAREAVKLGQDAARILRDDEEQRRKLLTQIYP
jgi:hypothetical protein